MKKLWKLDIDTGYGNLYGLFLATDEEIQSIMDGREIHFGEVCGKHSEVCGALEDGEITLFSDDEYVISHTQPFGYDPFEFIDDESEGD